MQRLLDGDKLFKICCYCSVLQNVAYRTIHSHGLFIDGLSPLEVMLQPMSWEFHHECYVGKVSKGNNCGLFKLLSWYFIGYIEDDYK
jgi:hypothetical protein